MNNLFTDYAKSLYDQNEMLNAKSMVKVLNSSLQSLSVEEVSIKQLDRMYQLNVDDRSLFNKRFDFVDLTNKRIYEFDGEQHFKLVDYFHDTYEDFVKNRDKDIAKQKFIVDYGFDLVRITGVLTVHQFIDILVKLNLQTGQSAFIKDDVYQVVNTNDLSCELDLVDMLKSEISRLNQKIQELNTDIKSDFDNEENTTLSDFLNDIKDNFYFIRYVSDEYLYIEYVNWHRHNMSGSLMSKINFKRELVPFMNNIGYRLVTRLDKKMKECKDRRNFRDKAYNYDDCYSYLISLNGNNQRVTDQHNVHKNSTYYEFTGDYFKSEEFVDIKRQIIEHQKFEYEDDRQQQICEILCKMHDFNNQ